MKHLKSLSLITVLITLIIVLFSLTEVFNNKQIVKENNSLSVYENDHIIQSLDRLQELSLQSSADTISSSELQFLAIEQSSQIADLKEQISYYQENKNNMKLTTKEDPFVIHKFWIKVVFSFIFTLAALFIVLSKKYDDKTKKWAFSVLTLIAGVWIGTIS